VIAAFLLAATVVALDGLVTVPTDWKSSPPPATAGSAVHFVGKWANPDSGEQISILWGPKLGESLATVAQRSGDAITRRLPGALLSSAPLKLCHDGDGWKQTYTDSHGGGITQVFAVTRARVYTAIYHYPGYPGTSAAGEAAVQSLCPGADPVVELAPAPIAAPKNWALQDPAGFVPTGNVVVWMWSLPGADPLRQGIEVRVTPSSQNPSAYAFMNGLVRADDNNLQTVARKPVRLCRSQSGLYLEQVADTDGGQVYIESVSVKAGGRMFGAFYWRLLTQPNRAEAESALRSLCPQ